MPVYLIRHAHAGSRSAWKGDDSARPLTPKGHRQAAAIAHLIGDGPIGHLITSPAVRCIETLTPLASRLELDVDVRPELGEGADLRSSYDLLVGLVPRNPALCGHGDLIPEVIDHMIGLGMRASRSAVSQKGSMWIIEFDAGTPVTGTYVPPAD